MLWGRKQSISFGDGGIGPREVPARLQFAWVLLIASRSAGVSSLGGVGFGVLEFGGDGGIGLREGRKWLQFGGFVDGLAQRGQLFGGVPGWVSSNPAAMGRHRPAPRAASWLHKAALPMALRSAASSLAASGSASSSLAATAA